MSLRNISELNQEATTARIVRPILFARLDFASGVRRLHTEIGPRTARHPVFGVETYDGIGDFGGITGPITESVSDSPYAVTIALSGVNASLMDRTLNDDYHGRDADLMFGFDDENGELLDDPVVVWSGYMDKVDVALSQGLADLSLTCESRAALLQGSSELIFSDEQKQSSHPGDLVAEYLYRMIDMTLSWGGDKIRNQGTSSGGGTPSDVRRYDAGIWR